VTRKDLPPIREVSPKLPTAPNYPRASAFICGKTILGCPRHEQLGILPQAIVARGKAKFAADARGCLVPTRSSAAPSPSRGLICRVLGSLVAAIGCAVLM
jgi:hypothetical protein